MSVIIFNTRESYEAETLMSCYYWQFIPINLSQLVGQMVHVVTFPGVERGKVYYRGSDNEKSTQLKLSKGNYETDFQLPP